MEKLELTIADIIDVNVKVQLVERAQNGKNSCVDCILKSLCGDARILKSDRCFQNAGEGNDYVYMFKSVEE